MDKEIRKIQIFIVTKNEVPNEFTEIRDFTNEINRHLEKAYSVSVDLLTIDDLDAPPQKQEKYKQQICESEIVFFLIFTEMTDFMKADFEVAFEKMKADGKPYIYTYFYKGEDKEPEPLVREFINNLENGINHYWSVYSHIDTIKLKILMCLKLSKLDMVEMEFRDGKLVIDNRDVMSLDNVPMFTDNDSMKSLKAKLQAVEEDYFSVKALYLEDKQNAEVRKKYIDLSTERENLKQKIEETEKLLFTQSLNMIKTSRGELTPRQREAYRLFEEGKSEIANEMLDAEEMEKDFELQVQRKEEEIKQLATIHIKELKTKIEILTTMTEYKERFSEIIDAYEKIMKNSFKYGVDYDSVCDYAWFLHKQGNSQKALEIGKKIEQIYNKENHISLYDKSQLWNLLGAVTDSIPDMQKETEKYYQKTIDIAEELVNKDHNVYLQHLAINYNNIANFYTNQENIDQAEHYYLKAIAISKELLDMNCNEYLPVIALSYNSIGIFYQYKGDFKQAKYYYIKAIIIRQKLVSINFKYLTDLVHSYTNVGNIYNIQESYKLAEPYYLKAIEIGEELDGINHNEYLATLAQIYNNIGGLYGKQGKIEQAEYSFLRAIDLVKELVYINSDRYLPDLAEIYSDMAVLYDIKKELEQAEYYYLEAITIREELVKKNRKRYESYLAISYFNYGSFKNDINYLKKAFDIAKKNLNNPNCRQIIDRLFFSVNQYN